MYKRNSTKQVVVPTNMHGDLCTTCLCQENLSLRSNSLIWRCYDYRYNGRHLHIRWNRCKQTRLVTSKHSATQQFIMARCYWFLCLHIWGNWSHFTYHGHYGKTRLVLQNTNTYNIFYCRTLYCFHRVLCICIRYWPTWFPNCHN